jgi:CheY-like chemotaxis protein
MRLLIVGSLKGQLTLATKLAMDKGATVTHAESAEQALRVLRAGRGADLLMVDVAIDIRGLFEALELERIHSRSSPAGPAPTRAPRWRRSTPAPRNTSRCRPTRS